MVTLVLGRGGSTSRIVRRISSRDFSRRDFGSNGNVPVSSSYRITPSAYTSVRVSMSRPPISACSGLMYSGVPTSAPISVCSVRSVSDCVIAFATPKSMIFGAGSIVANRRRGRSTASGLGG